MATQIKLGDRPKSFKKSVTFPMLDGTTGVIVVTYKYRTRKEFGAFMDSIIDAPDAQVPKDDFTMAGLMERTTCSTADYVMKVVDAWSLDEAFTHSNVQQLSDEIPAATAAIMENYRVAINEGRLGN